MPDSITTIFLQAHQDYSQGFSKVAGVEHGDRKGLAAMQPHYNTRKRAKGVVS
jgi:hypothetical protein